MSDHALLEALASFEEADLALDRSLTEGLDVGDQQFIQLHEGRENACSQAVALGAAGTPGIVAKARMLIAAMKVVAPVHAERQLHEDLAESLARDVMALFSADKLHQLVSAADPMRTHDLVYVKGYCAHGLTKDLPGRLEAQASGNKANHAVRSRFFTDAQSNY